MTTRNIEICILQASRCNNSGCNLSKDTKLASVEAWKEIEEIMKVVDCSEEVEQKPVLGIAPVYVWRWKRIDELLAAMTRYREAGKDIPTEWVNELTENLREVGKA